MTQLPFKVSARTAKLIGQENFTNAEGAIIELVKNSYDADAKNCLVVFDIVFENIPETISSREFEKISNKHNILNSFYTAKKDKYYLKNFRNKEKFDEIKDIFLSQNSLYIIDDGEGMNSEVIQNQWMEIGTGNKEVQFITKDGRVKTGAKGIGRFALDRLGKLSELWTMPKITKKAVGYYWKMDWMQFDKPNLSIQDIKADFAEEELNLKELITKKLKNISKVKEYLKEKDFFSGTIIKISNLKDNWNEQSLLNVYKNLEALIPPQDLSIPFSVNLCLLQKPALFGGVGTAFYNDFDYKIAAKYNAKSLNVHFTIIRNELDITEVEEKHSELFIKKKFPYNLKALKQKEFEITISVFEVLKVEKDVENEALLKGVGNFSFTFYFLKNIPSKDYPYKNFNAAERKRVLEKFGGIKIYRDSFRVRPYGNSGNDWLKLGDRAAGSPAGAGQRIGDWRVGPNQITGLISISRVENSSLIDKSDRGALIENESFNILTKVLVSIINFFELDRSIILNPFYIESKRKKDEKRQVEIRNEAEKLADKIVEERRKVEERVIGSRTNLFREKQEKQEKEAFKKIIEDSLNKVEKKDEEDAENAQIRTLASLGLIVSTFAHELKDIRNNLDELQKLEKIFHSIIPEKTKQEFEFQDGIDILDLLKKDNKKIDHWVNYSLTAIKKDKRKRSSLKFENYFQNLKKSWEFFLNNRNIKLKIQIPILEQYYFRAFEMDLDTVFNNLISNSIEAFNNLGVIRDRVIVITTELLENKMSVIYFDNGPGLPSIFSKNKDEIFLPFMTSKKDQELNDIGTGLGMFLVKSVIQDYHGDVEIMDAIGFKIKMQFPVKINSDEI